MFQSCSSFFQKNTTNLNQSETRPVAPANLLRQKRSSELIVTTSPPTFTATVSPRTLPTGMTTSSVTLSASRSTYRTANTDAEPTLHTVVKSSSSFVSQSHSSAGSSVTSMPPATLPHRLTEQSHTNTSASALTPGQLRLSTRDASVTAHISIRSTAVSGTPGATAASRSLALLS